MVWTHSTEGWGRLGRRCIGLEQEIEEADVLWMIVLAHPG